MINQRQGGRRRGRGGQRGQNLGGQPGNRQDNRQRGNAAQLLEKYKNLARDAQLAGDRVQTEYYLQYADHYYRVLGENRARFEDQRRPRGDDLDEDEREEEMADAGDGEGDEREERDDRRERSRGRDRDRGERRPRYSREEREAEDADEQVEARPAMNGGDSLPLDVLPPAIGADGAVSLTPDEEPAPARPRRRSRVTRPAEGEDDVAPAA